MHYKLLAALLVSAPLMAALTYEEAVRKLNAAQADLGRVESRIQQSRTHLDENHQRVSSLEGKYEHREDITRHTADNRAKMKQHNAAVKERAKAIHRLEVALQEVGRDYNVVSEGNCKYRVEKVERKETKPEPIRYESERPYKRARVAY